MVQRPAPAPEAPSAKQRDILRAASTVFRRRGLQAAGMREIASELGMAVGNLYYYFESREDLLAYCQLETLEGLLALAERERKAPGSPAEKLRRLLRGHVIQLNETTPGSLAHLDVEALSGERRARIVARRDAYERALQELICEGVGAGLFRPVDPKVASFALLGAVNWTVKWFRPDGAKSAAEIGEECAELLVRGLLRPDGAEVTR